MAKTQYDLTVIGGGSGGLVAARIATALGANVLLLDKERIGGDCLNYGCVPSKSLLHVARIVQQAKEALSLGLTPANLDVDMAKVTEYIQGVIKRVAESERAYVDGVTVRFGQVSFQSPTELLLAQEKITSRSIVIATGSRPAIPEIEGLEETGFLTNESAFSLTHMPASLVIIGGGPVAVELGQAFSRLGSQVTIIQSAACILPREDPEVSSTITNVLKAEGIHIITQAQVVSVSRKEQKKVVTVMQGTEHLQVEAEEILLAAGRQPNIAGLNLDAAGIAYEEQRILVDDYLQTSVPHILAIGDVIGGYLFTHVAAYQAGIAVRNALLPVGKKKVDYRVVPWCTFTDPEVAHIGLTPQEAEQQYKQIRVVKLPWADIDRAQAENETIGFVKLVLAGKKDEIVGAHMVGARAGEMLGEIALAMQHHLTINDIFNTIHTYPTMNVGIQQAAFEAYLESTAAMQNRKIIRTVLTLRG